MIITIPQNTIQIIDDLSKSRAFLIDVSKQFLDKHKYQFLLNIGIELEFYFSLSDNHRAENISIENQEILFCNIRSKFGNEGLDLFSDIVKESGNNQYEIIFSHDADIIKVCDQIMRAKTLLVDIVADFSLAPNFRAKPFEDDMSSGLHVNISLTNPSNNYNLLNDKNLMLFEYVIGGLLKNMNKYMIFFAQSEEDYKRFNMPSDQSDKQKTFVNGNEDITGYSNAPINVSWGINNRTTAIRVPYFSDNDSAKHVEHRVSSASSNPYLVLSSIIASIDDGITNKIMPAKPIYGNAFDSQYDLTKFPSTIEDALYYFKN